MMLAAVLLFFAGTLLIIKGGDFFIDAAGWVSDATGISKAVIGATIVSLATTSPEYFVSTIAAIKGYNELSIGNAVGSLSANLGFAFALLALFTPCVVKDRLYGVKGLIMIASTAALRAFCLSGTVSVTEAVILLGIFACSVFLNIRWAKDGEDEQQRIAVTSRDIAVNTAKFVGGAAGIILGSNLIVDNGKIMAAQLGVSETVIGLTFVAIGTSLPEIVTSVAAIVKKQNALSIGNIFGANILDATLILATGSFITQGNLSVAQLTVTRDLPITLLLMLLAVLPTAISRRIYRWQGILMAGIYLSYLVYVTLF